MCASSLSLAVMGAAALALWYRCGQQFRDRADTALDDLVPVPESKHLVFRDVATWDGLSDHVRPHTYVAEADAELLGLLMAGEDVPQPGPALESR